MEYKGTDPGEEPQLFVSSLTLTWTYKTQTGF